MRLEISPRNYEIASFDAVNATSGETKLNKFEESTSSNNFCHLGQYSVRDLVSKTKTIPPFLAALGQN